MGKGLIELDWDGKARPHAVDSVRVFLGMARTEPRLSLYRKR
jgi:hypothetical protein